MCLPRFFAKFCCLLLAVLFSGCGKKMDPVNVVIVTIDTTRADSIGCYGNSRSRTPAIDGLAEEGILFEKAYTPVPITCPSHATMMTGQVPFGHGIRDNGLFILSEDKLTLAEILSDHGYSCGAAIGSFPLLSRFGLDQGFDFYDEQLGKEFLDIEGNRVIKKQRLFFDERKAGLVNESLFPWLEKNHQSPFFLWAHYFDPHHPHEPPPPYDSEFADDLYLGEVAYSDECIGVLVQKLKDLGVYENTLIIVLSDHGEGRGQHNEDTHSLLAYNSTLHIPLVIRNPEGAKGRRVPDRVGTVDLLPTILERIGIRVPTNLQGQSLLGHISPESATPADKPSNILYAETLSPRLSHGLGEIRALYEGKYKYLHGPAKELFDIEKDHDEIHNLIQAEPEIAAAMRSKLEIYLAENATEAASQQVAIDEETRRRLMALGYLGSGGIEKVGPERLRDDGVAPQERVIDNGLLSTAKHFLYQQKPTQARQAIEDLLERAPRDAAYLSMMADCERMSGNFAAALSIYEELLESEQAAAVIQPSRILLTMGELSMRSGDPESAIRFIRESRDLEDSAVAHFLLSGIYASENRTAERYESLKKCVSFEEHPLEARLDLAVLEAQRDQLSAAENHFLAALRSEPYSSRAHFNYAVFLFLEHPERHEESLRFAQRVIELHPVYIPAYNLALQLLAEAGNFEKAHALYSQAVSINPHHDLIPAMKEVKDQFPQP